MLQDAFYVFETYIPLKSGRCCKAIAYLNSSDYSSQSLWSQGGAASSTLCLTVQDASHNPFEVREVLQETHGALTHTWTSLNPFEVREVLQDRRSIYRSGNRSQSLWSQGGAARWGKWVYPLLRSVSIPLKSGRCCKNYKGSGDGINNVSIPLKSGRCCKKQQYIDELHPSSQSLWSQGGAARGLT